jgi:hypothetical protein
MKGANEQLRNDPIYMVTSIHSHPFLHDIHSWENKFECFQSDRDTLGRLDEEKVHMVDK